MNLIHLTSSRFFGGPERQMLELGYELKDNFRSTFLSFLENGLCYSFLEKVNKAGFKSHALKYDTPRLFSAARELRQIVLRSRADIVLCHGHKANLLGRVVTKFLKVPAIAVSRGWTGENFKVSLYELLDRQVLKSMDHVVCVSEKQARKVYKGGVNKGKICVIHNAIRINRFDDSLKHLYRKKLESFFSVPPTIIIGAAGRLSPEKGFDLLISSCSKIKQDNICDFGVVLFGEGIQKDVLRKQIEQNRLERQFILANFTNELDCFMPCFDIFVQSSHTEGLPNVLLEASAAQIPIVATNVGGTNEVVKNRETGLIVEPDSVQALADGITFLINNEFTRNYMRYKAHMHVKENFTFERQAEKYISLFMQFT